MGVVRGMVEVVARILWASALLGAVYAGLNFFLLYLSKALTGNAAGIGAPALAALAGETLVYAVVPYVAARAFDEAARPLPKIR